MTPYYSRDGITIFHADCRELLAGMDAGSVDAVITDPPYGLSFMGKKWDYNVPSVEAWAECLRVLKPGAHLLAFAGTRTQHRMAVRIEDAGFEIRDMIAWVYGSGFPKSLDVSKAIDKTRAEDVEPVRVICRAIRAAMGAKGLKSRDLTQHFGDCHPRLIDHWAARDTDSQPSLPTWEQWATLRDLLDMGDDHDAEVWRLNWRKGKPGDLWQNAEVIGEHEGATPGFGEHRFNVRDAKIRAASKTAAQWQGWGTALKPALEPITVARKPLVGTVAENVLAHGTGAINVDGCRVGDEVRVAAFTSLAPCHGNALGAAGTAEARRGTQGNPKTYVGRWPANLIHDGSEEVLAAFPDTGKSTGGQASIAKGFGEFGGGYRTTEKRDPGYGDSGSAARFFYCAKASKRDRGEGNTHPTVKPSELMQYLCRLVTPDAATILDPFAGSCTTGVAAWNLGRKAILCEISEEYCELGAKRLDRVISQGRLFKPEPVRETQGTLFEDQLSGNPG